MYSRLPSNSEAFELPENVDVMFLSYWQQLVDREQMPMNVFVLMVCQQLAVHMRLKDYCAWSNEEIFSYDVLENVVTDGSESTMNK